MWSFFLFINWLVFSFEIWLCCWKAVLSRCGGRTLCRCRTKWPGDVIFMLCHRRATMLKSLPSLLFLHNHIEESGLCRADCNKRWLCLVSALLLDVLTQAAQSTSHPYAAAPRCQLHLFVHVCKSLRAAAVKAGSKTPLHLLLLP